MKYLLTLLTFGLLFPGCSVREIPQTTQACIHGEKFMDQAHVDNPDSASAGKRVLWYREPAGVWLDAMPLGNGHIGAMVYGGVNREQIALNEATMWSGEKYEGVIDRGREVLPAVQKFLIDGKFEEAEKLIAQMGETPEAKARVGTHLPVGDLFIDFAPDSKNYHDYRRRLDMERGVAHVEFACDGAHYRREAFVSNPDKVLVIRMEADRKRSHNFTISAAQWLPKVPLGQPTVQVHEDELVLSGQALEKLHSAGIYGVHFEVRVKVLASGGSTHASGKTIQIKDADAATLLVSITTNFRDFDYINIGKRRIAAAAKKTYPQLLQDHVVDFQPRMRRVDLNLNSHVDTTIALPTDERLKLFKQKGNDPGLIAQFFQFGRYLTLAGSREDSLLPMALQGLWSDSKAASMGWSDAFYFDINGQQNYWAAEVGNLSECHLPMMDYIDQLRHTGREAARRTYGARGWCAQVTANAWAAATFRVWAPNHGGAPTCGTWQATHLWNHYEFTGDKEFLAKTAYPILKENAEFYLDFMIKDPRTGWLVTCPAYSPENQFIEPVSGQHRGHTVGNTGDSEVIYELFRECIEASKILGIDADFRVRLEQAQAQLPPLEKLIHKDGRLMEWLDPRFDGEYARRHRHTHHLLGLFPFDQITPDKTPILAQAARVTLADKQKNLEDTEWTRANYIHFYARLRDGNEAYNQLATLLRNSVPGGSLLTVSLDLGDPTNAIFCMDANTAGTSGIAEMLLQSHSGQIELLPALPEAWPSGSFRGLRARGGFEVDLEWREGRLTAAKIRSVTGETCTLRYGQKTTMLQLVRGQSKQFDAQLE